MYDTPIPMINYVLVTITASVLAYATAMDIDEKADDGLEDAKEPETEPEEDEEAEEPVEEEEEAEAEKEEPAEEVPMAEAQVVPQAQPEKGGPAVGGKHNARKIKKTKRNAPNSKKHKQTRNKSRSK